MKENMFCHIVYIVDKDNLHPISLRCPRLTEVLAAIVCILTIGVGSSWAGPPFVTDDPEPVEYQHGEFYLATQYAKDRDVTSGTAPHFEFNYGVKPDVMVHLITPFAFAGQEGQSLEYGYGDTEVGIKYRFLNKQDFRFMVGTFPLVELPTGDSDKGLGAGQTRFFMPLWLQKGWGAWQSYGGGGYWRNPGPGNKDYWFFGWQVQRDLSKELTLGAELFYNTKTSEDGKSRTGFNAGVMVNFTDDHHLLFSVGRDISGENNFSSYLAYQYTFGPWHEKK
jgi:Putative MetA-pathway of phenol degradation